ncbi:MAG TPA: ABC transporter permease subunit [Stellaceae bacterium]|nr:ABC transporter permease subunit [Stellaceae bacterium]
MAEADVSGVAAAAAPHRKRSAPRIALIRVATLLVLWALWESVSASGLLYKGVAPSSFAIAGAIGHEIASGDFYWNLEWTLYEVAASIALGCGLGLAAGLGLGVNRFAGAAYERYLQYMAPTPKIVFLPVLLVLFGVGAGSKIAMGALSCFFPMALSVAAGVRLVDPVLLRVGKSYNLTRAQMVRMIYLPALMPPIATGLRIGLGVAIIGCLLAELKMSNRGLGFMMMQYYAQFRTPQMYAILIVMFLIAVFSNALVARVFRPRGTR